MPTVQELIAEKSREDLTMEDLDALTRMSHERLSEITELALGQEPPNTEIAAVVGGICAAHYFGWTEYPPRNRLLRGVTEIFPATTEELNRFRTKRVLLEAENLDNRGEI